MFQLVLQFAPWSDRDFDDLARLEEQLDAVLPSAEVDGHDLGSNEANIFVFCAEAPHDALVPGAVLHLFERAPSSQASVEVLE